MTTIGKNVSHIKRNVRQEDPAVEQLCRGINCFFAMHCTD